MPMDNAEREPGAEPTSIWLDPQTRQALDAKARQLDRSRSWLVRHLIRQALGIMTERSRGE